MDILKRYNRDSNIINSYYNEMSEVNHLEILSDIYKYIKSITKFYYIDNKELSQYKLLREDLVFAEKKINDIRLLNSIIKFDKIKDNDFLDNLIYKVRNYLLLKHGFSNDYSNFRILNLANDCYRTAHYIKNYCDNNKIESYLLPIYPGYKESAKLYNGNGYHFANIIKYINKYYLVDITYSQFFYTVRNNLDRLGVMGISGCNPGVFMLMSNQGYKIADKIINDGYIELNDEIFKVYLDAFTVSFRNVLYYEETNDFSYTTNYTVDDYIRFLNGDDSQINHENRLYLGYQSIPLKNYKINFKRY